MPRLVLLALLLAARPAGAQTPSPCVGGSAVDTLDANNVRASLYNNGSLFWNGSRNVFNVPKAPPGSPITPNAVFTYDLWFGGYAGADLVQAASNRNGWDYVPGPLDAQGRLPADCTRYDRIVSIRLRDLQALRNGTVTEAVRDWPWRWGAPVVDGDGVSGNYNLAGGDRPELLGTESHWWVMNAMGAHPRTGSKPFPLEIQVTAFATPTLPHFPTLTPAVGNSVLVRYRLVWRGTTPLTDAYFGFHLDPDLGNATDDYVGSDTTLRMGYVYNADNFDEGADGYGADPPALGVLALAGPPVHDDDHDRRADTHGFTSFLYYHNDPGNNGRPRQNTDDYYKYMRARWQNGQVVYACGDGHASQFASCGPARWIYPGDPVTGAFWSERKPVDTAGSQANASSDRHFAMGMGPFTLGPGAARDIVVAFVWARGSDHLHSVDRLRQEAAALQVVWTSGGYTAAANQDAPTPSPPSPPALAVGAVTPSPLHGVGTIRVSLPVATPVRVWIVDVHGRTVARLHEGPMDAGTHEVPLDGATLAPGVYAVRVWIGGAVVSRPLVVVR